MTMSDDGCPGALSGEPFDGDGHSWRIIDARIEGRGSMSTYTVEQCTRCKHLRLDHDVEVIEEVGTDE